MKVPTYERRKPVIVTKSKSDRGMVWVAIYNLNMSGGHTTAKTAVRWSWDGLNWTDAVEV